MSLSISTFSWPIRLLVAENLSTPLILGWDFISKAGLVVDPSRGTFYFQFRPSMRIAFCECRSGGRGNVFTVKQDYPDVSHLSSDQETRVKILLSEYPKVITDRLGVTNQIEYEILLTDQIPVRKAPYRLSPPKMRVLRDKIEQMLRDGVIRYSTSPYASPVFLVPKAGKNDHRVVVDYRLLNQKVVLESVPLPDLHNCFTWFQGASYFTVLDLNQAYFQIPLAENSKRVTAFTTDWNLFEFNRVPFGLATGAAVLSRLLDRVLGDLKFDCVYNYLDDLVIYSKSFEDHLQHLRLVLDRLGLAGLTVRPSKISLCKRAISFLGHIVSERGVEIDQERTRAIREFPPPRDKQGIARFIGMCNYFRKFVPQFAELAAPLNRLRGKDVEFCWGEEQQNAFQALRTAIANPPVLAIPDFKRQFIVQTDASRGGVAAVLLQEQDGERRPLAFASRTLSQAERNYSIYECEALAVLFAFEKFVFYLEHSTFILETDNQALSWVLARPRKTGRIARWAVRISSFRFQVKHIRGSDNGVADALSRMFSEQEQEGQVAAILTEVPELFCNLPQKQVEDDYWGPIYKRVKDGEAQSDYELCRGILCKKQSGSRRCFCIPKGLAEMVIKYFHDSVVSGHLGFSKTLNRVREKMFWPGMYTDVKRYVASCEACKWAKPDVGGRAGLLQSERCLAPLERLFVDYLGPLPRTKRGHRYILVVVDAFTRFTWLLPTRGVTADITIKQLTSVFAWFGPPRSIVTDNAPAFLSAAFKGFLFSQGIHHVTTTPYYPKGSFAERVNRNLKAALCIFHARSPKGWDLSLPWLNQAFNSARHEATGSTPNALLFGYAVNSPLSNLWSINDLLPQHITPASLRENWQRARRNVLLAHQREARYYNRGRRPFRGRVGDVVFIRDFRPSGADTVKGKLRPPYQGPFRIVKVLGPVNLLVEQLGSRRSRRVHVSQVKLASNVQPVQRR